MAPPRRWRPALLLLATLALIAGIGLGWPLALPPAPEPVRVLDRNGLLVAERPVPAQALGEQLTAVPPYLGLATMAAEDHRFRWHPGVDPIAVLRAARADLAAGRVVQGGSTITQQLARSVWERPPGLRGKLWEAWVALRLEARLSKDTILVAYLNRTYYGSLAYGADAAARTYLDKPATALSLAEAALLAALPRRPSELDPWADPEGARAARDRVLARMEALGWIDPDEAALAQAEPLGLRDELPWYHAPHFVRRLPRPDHGGDLRTTLDLGLQREVQAIAQRTIAGLRDWGVDQAAVLVLDTRTNEVLAYLGSTDWSAADGQVDGVTAPRSPGSALKPFAYWLGLERGPDDGITLASVLDDLPGSWATSHGSWMPDNYDERFHGPITARDALAQSLNLPAVRLTERIGVADLQRRLQDLGLTTLEERPAHYGLGLVLGDCEVRLEELVGAYAALGRLGRPAPLRFLPSAEPVEAEPQVGDPAAAWLVLQALDDPDARAPAFGRDSVLEPDFFWAAKTGTSVGWRDNWAVGVSPERTIGVWVGNFDGRPMREVSGISGAGPILLQVARAAHAQHPTAPPPRPPGIEQARVCPLSGLRVGPDCPGGREELFLTGTAPQRTCDWHRLLPLDDQGALAHGCPGSHQALVVAWPAPYSAWAAETDQPRWPDEDRSCQPLDPDLSHAGALPGSHERTAAATTTARAAIASPAAGGAYYLDPRDPPDQQALPLRAAAPPGTRQARWLVDGKEIAVLAPPFAGRWIPSPGQHRITLELDGVVVDEVEVWVGGGGE